MAMAGYGTAKAFGKARSVIVRKPEEEFELIRDAAQWCFMSRPVAERAEREHERFTHLLEAEGIEVHGIESEDTPPPNLCFTRDIGLVTRNGAILASFRPPCRQGEQLYLQLMADELDIPVVAEMRNVQFEGGDFVQIADDVGALGIGRTSYAGYEALDELLDMTLLPVPLENRETHLNSFFSMVRPDLALACAEFLPAELMGFLSKQGIDYINVSRDEMQRLAADSFLVEGGKVIMEASCKEAIKALEQRDVHVLPADLRELRKGWGGPGSLALVVSRR
jgi:N-dimethylarginine dimethylaminohydrolase